MHLLENRGNNNLLFWLSKWEDVGLLCIRDLFHNPEFLSISSSPTYLGKYAEMCVECFLKKLTKWGCVSWTSILCPVKGNAAHSTVLTVSERTSWFTYSLNLIQFWLFYQRDFPQMTAIARASRILQPSIFVKVDFTPLLASHCQASQNRQTVHHSLRLVTSLGYSRSMCHPYTKVSCHLNCVSNFIFTPIYCFEKKKSQSLKI